MNEIEALEYLEHVVEADTDIDPGIQEVIVVPALALEAARERDALHDALYQLERASVNFALSTPCLTESPKDALEEMISALQAARVLLRKQRGRC